VDGSKRAAGVAQTSAVSGPPADLQSRHLPPALTSCLEQVGRVVVPSRYPDSSARCQTGDDDSARIQRAIDENPGKVVFLPKGTYCIREPITLQRDSHLQGLARHLTMLRAAPGPRAAVLPLVRTVADRDATTSLSFVKLSVQADVGGAATALTWEVGARSVVRSINFSNPHWDETEPSQTRPFAEISGAGGGRWYETYNCKHENQGSGYRHLLVANTTEPLRFYQLNPEHARPGSVTRAGGPEPQIELRNVSDVSIYGLKAEGNYPALWILDSERVRVTGYGGNASAIPGQAIIRVARSRDFSAANLVDFHRQGECSTLAQCMAMACWDHYAGCKADVSTWWMIREDDLPSAPEPSDRPALYLRGNP
jgi:hypothetical protein